MEKIPSFDSMVLSVAIWAFGTVLGPSLGVMMLIFFGWFVGVVIGVWRMEEPVTRVNTVWFVLLSFIVTVGGAGTLANKVAPHMHSTPFELLFFVAILLPGIGMSWVDIAKWFVVKYRRLLQLKFRGDSP